VFRQNPKIITHTGQTSPYGYMDWWPISLYVNNERPPFDQKDVRWALSYYLDRRQLIEVGYLGANTPSKLPLPPYPPLLPYFDAVKDLLAKYDTNEFAPKRSDSLLAAKGFKKDGEGFWVDAQGKRLNVNIIGFGASGPAIGPVLVEMLKRRGVEAGMALPPDFDSRFQKGEFDGAIYGHGGSVNEPYATLRLYQGASIAVPGAHQANFARWKNAEYDKLVDDAVEGFFAKLTKRRLKRGVFRSIVDLQAAINRSLKETNDDPKPFVRTADPDKIIAAVKRGYQALGFNH